MGTVPHVVIAPLSALFLLSPGFIPAHTKLCLHVENNVSALAAVVYAYNLLLSGMVFLADIRCRDFRDVEGIQVDSLRNVMRFTYAIISLAPLALVVTALFLLLR